MPGSGRFHANGTPAALTAVTVKKMRVARLKIVTAVNAAGVPLAWNRPLPGISLTLVQIFLLVALLLGVFCVSARTKSILFNRFLVNSGLDRSLQYAISQIISNIVLVVGVFIVLDNAGIHLGTLTVFAGAV